jgi:cytidylate kinase
MHGTNGERIAKQVAGKLNYSFYGEEELLKVADQMGFLRDVEKLDGKRPSLFEMLFTQKPRVYLNHLQDVIFEAAKGGNAVFFNKGGLVLLDSFDSALHVLVTGSLERRIERITREQGVGKEIAEKKIRHSDRGKRAFFRFAFSEDWLNPNLYDLILNTDKLSIESAIELVVGLAESEEIKTRGANAVKILGESSLHRQAESALHEAGLTNPRLLMTVEDLDSIRLYGLVDSLEEKEMAAKAVLGIKDIKKITNDVIVSGEYTKRNIL